MSLLFKFYVKVSSRSGTSPNVAGDLKVCNSWVSGVRLSKKDILTLKVYLSNSGVARVVSDVGHHKTPCKPPIGIGRIVGDENRNPIRTKGCIIFPSVARCLGPNTLRLWFYRPSCCQHALERIKRPLRVVLDLDGDIPVRRILRFFQRS